MPEHDGPVRHTQGLGRPDIFKIARAQKLGTHQSNKRRPAKQNHQENQHSNATAKNSEHNNDDVKRGRSAPNLKHALECQIKPPAKETLHGTGNNADRACHTNHGDCEQNRQAEPIDRAR